MVQVKLNNSYHGTSVYVRTKNMPLTPAQVNRVWETLCGDHECKHCCPKLGVFGDQDYDIVPARNSFEIGPKKA